jgi:hypothetical protein
MIRSAKFAAAWCRRQAARHGRVPRCPACSSRPASRWAVPETARDTRAARVRAKPRTRTSSTRTLEAIRALGVRTDLPTLGKIFGISRARAYQMAHTGEWEQAGIRVVPLGSRYVVAVQSILDVLGPGDADPRSETSQRVQPAARSRAG